MLIPDDAAGCAGGGVAEAAGVVAAGAAAIVIGAGCAVDSASVACTFLLRQTAGGPLVMMIAVSRSPFFRSPIRTCFPSL
jgi:hypothetical protein